MFEGLLELPRGLLRLRICEALGLHTTYLPFAEDGSGVSQRHHLQRSATCGDEDGIASSPRRSREEMRVLVRYPMSQRSSFLLSGKHGGVTVVSLQETTVGRRALILHLPLMYALRVNMFEDVSKCLGFRSCYKIGLSINPLLKAYSYTWFMPIR